MALSRQGVLSGTPDTAGEYDLNITAFNNVDSVTSTLTLKVAGINDPDPAPSPDPSRDIVGSADGGCNDGIGAVFMILAVTCLCVKRSR